MSGFRLCVLRDLRRRDTPQLEYDFSGAVRGATTARYAEGTNVVVLDPELRGLFPTSEAVNDALRDWRPLRGAPPV